MKPYETRLREYSEMIEYVGELIFEPYPPRQRTRRRLNDIFNWLLKRKHSLIPEEKGISIFLNGQRISEEQYKEYLINN